jgi:hypothetical protein
LSKECLFIKASWISLVSVITENAHECEGLGRKPISLQFKRKGGNIENDILHREKTI